MPRVPSAERVIALLLLSSALAGCSRVTIPPDRRPLTDVERSVNLVAFDEVGSIIESTYFAPERLQEGDGGVDWTAACEKLRPRAEQATTMHEARAAIDALIDHLGETHFALLPVNGVDVDPRSKPAGAVGITVRIVDNKAVVWRVDRDSSAARAGVQPGWTLVRVERTDIADLIKPATQPTTRSVTRSQRRAQDSLAARPAQRITATFVDAIGHGHRVSMTAVTNAAEVAKLGDLPPMSLRLDSATLLAGIGYFSLSSFLDPPRVMPAFEAFMHKHADAPGIILDLRGNPGGISGMASGLAGYFIDHEGASLGTMVTRADRLPFMINPRLPGYRGKLAILVDGQTESTSEILAAGLQDLGRARIFGEPTAGAALPSTVTTLSNGDRFQYAVADFIRVNGQRIEGRGVRPDEIVPLTRSALLANLDSPLEHAIDWIRLPSTRPSTNATTIDTADHE